VLIPDARALLIPRMFVIIEVAATETVSIHQGACP
jgi:hypothetical protein